MPSTQKMLFFLFSAVLSGAAVAVLGYGLSANWVESTMTCGSVGSSNFTGTSTILMGLFNGAEKKLQCPIFDSDNNNLVVFPELNKVKGGVVIVQGLVVCLLVLALLASAGSIFITLYNTFSNPYETYMGPTGLFVCSGLSASMAFLSLILYLVNLFGLKMAVHLAELDTLVSIKDQEVSLQVGWYMLLPYIALSLLAIVLVFLYTQLAYTQRRQQERPTDDAPKDILMF